LQRSEAAAIILRVVNADVRVDLSFAVPLSAERIYSQSSPAVFFVEAFDRNDELIRTGSGFFICETGIAVTNHHVIVGANSAQVTTIDGEVWAVYGISDYNAFSDIALIKIEGSDFSYLEMADSSKILTGATIYTLGSPLGLQATFSRGIVSQSFREVDGMQFIQIDAPISSGSSGGALLDAYGRVVGITTATLMGAAVVQNLNLAVPINLIHDLYADNFETLESLIPDVDSYEGFYPIPDFGKFFGVEVFNVDEEDDGVKHAYLISDLPDDVETILAEYEHLLAQLLFSFLAEVTVEGIDFRMFRAPYDNIVVMIGVEIVNDEECVTIEKIKFE
jgi:S1-C subfamily serine protease